MCDILKYTSADWVPIFDTSLQDKHTKFVDDDVWYKLQTEFWLDQRFYRASIEMLKIKKKKKNSMNIHIPLV